ncbi:hypothetical protein Cyast_1751 [Cyanobacterium stanieri PCC 7202]|uniref:Uncharacterized protein n=1 Tax=Cyanobacterium stanieri (strain ATCC 29140 / PCC 7202) TaxID=292563 RepID=K9YMM8_CYASC|nr:hypothetical protein Cyast_1751 [Cyanobacterium stanieri PCC 7202]
MIKVIKKITNDISSLCVHSMLFLLKTSPFLLVIFIGFGDQFLPQPLSKTSRDVRNSITNALSIGENSEVLENNKYNNNRSDQIIKDLSR